MLAITWLFELRVHSDTATSFYRDKRHTNNVEKSTRLSNKSDALKRVVDNSRDMSWNTKKKFLKASTALKGAAAKLLSQDRKNMPIDDPGRLKSRTPHGSQYIPGLKKKKRSGLSRPPKSNVPKFRKAA